MCLDTLIKDELKMATKEAQAQLAILPERVSVLETKVENIDEKLVDLKSDVKEMHDCLDQTRDKVMAELSKMQDEYRSNSAKFFDHADKLHAEDVESHGRLAGRIGELELIKNKGIMYGMVVLAFLAGTGWVGHLDLKAVVKFIGL